MDIIGILLIIAGAAFTIFMVMFLLGCMRLSAENNRRAYAEYVLRSVELRRELDLENGNW